MGKKVPKAYIPENLEYLAKSLEQLRYSKNEGGKSKINLEELQKAIRLLERKDRKSIERFWGLNGGINHSKKLTSSKEKDAAFMMMSSNAIESLNKLFRLDYIYMYDEGLKEMVTKLAKKINKNLRNTSDVEAIKYLIALLVILQNGPKMPFEEDSMSIDTSSSEELIFDEYAIIQNALQELENLPEGSINLKLIHNFIEMLDFKDSLAIKKTFCIDVPKSELPEGFDYEETATTYTLGEVREFKERVFPYGSWEVTNNLILGDTEVSDKLKDFMECLDIVRKDWAKLAEFKVGIKQLRTPHEVRSLDVYNVGGLEFTDIYEIMFLYLERNVILSEN